MVQKISGHDVRVMVGATALSAEAMVVFSCWLGQGFECVAQARVRGNAWEVAHDHCRSQLSGGGVRKIPSGGINLPLGDRLLPRDTRVHISGWLLLRAHGKSQRIAATR